MNRVYYHRVLYVTAALWNWILGAAFLILPRIDIGWFRLAGDTIPPTLLWFDCFMGLVFILGVGFYIVSLNPHNNHGLVQVAIIEKIWVFVVGLYYFVVGQAALPVLIVVTGDLAFGLLFLEDLLAIRRNGA